MSRTWHHSPSKEKIAARKERSRKVAPRPSIRDLAEGGHGRLLSRLIHKDNVFEPISGLQVQALVELTAYPVQHPSVVPHPHLRVNHANLATLLKDSTLPIITPPGASPYLTGLQIIPVDIANGMKFTWNPDTSSYDKALLVNRVQEHLTDQECFPTRYMVSSGTDVIPGQDDTEVLFALYKADIPSGPFYMTPSAKDPWEPSSPFSLHAAVIADLR